MGLLAGRVDSEAVDLPGFGHSPPPAEGYRLGTHARAVIGQLEDSGRRPGAPVRQLARRRRVDAGRRDRPDLVRTLTLVSPALPDLRPNAGQRPAPAAAAAARASPRSPGGALAAQDARSSAPAPCSSSATATPPAYRRAARSRRPWTRSAGAAGWPTRATRSRARCAAWSAPTWRAAPARLGGRRPGCGADAARLGRPDRLVDVALAPRAADTIPDSRLLVLADVGHVAQMERPDLVARAFLGLLDEVAPTPGVPAP